MRNALKRSLSLILALVMVVSMTLPAHAEPTKLEELQALLAEIDAMNGEDYTEESWTELKSARDSIYDPTQLPE